MKRNERERERERRAALNKLALDSANDYKNAESNNKITLDSAIYNAESAINSTKSTNSKQSTKLAESKISILDSKKDSYIHTSHFAWNDKVGRNFAESSPDSANPKQEAISKTATQDESTTKSAFILKLINNLFPPHSALSQQDFKTYRDISIFAILNIFFLICVFSPFALYLSDVTQFDSTQTISTLSALFGYFLLLSGSAIYVTSFFYKSRLLKIGAFAVIVVLVINVSYAFIFRGNIFTGRPYAQIDGLLFQDGGAGLSSIWAKYFDIGYGFAMMFVVLLLLIFCKKYLKRALILLLLVMCISSTIDSAKIYFNTRKTAPKAQITKSQTTNFQIPSELLPYFSFSKDKNILVIFSDTVQSDNFTQALKDFPELRDEFSGFTFYTNTLSVANITFGSAPAISGGAHYSPDKINARKQEHNITIEGTSAVTNSANAFSNAGFSVALGTSYPSNDTLLAKAINKDIFIFPQNKNHIWGDFYRQNFPPKHIDMDNRPIGELFSYGLFRASPYIFRTRIYLLGGWIFGNSIYANHLQHTTNQAGIFLALAKNVQVDSAKPTFKFVYEGLEHFPWMLRYEHNCKPIDNIAQYRSKLINNKDDLAYSNHLCYVKNLLSYLNALKNAGIYDNTKIIIVSDHGNGGLGAPIINFPIRAARNSHIFFMVKNFGAKGKLKIDNETFITNADTMAVACDEIDSACPNIAPSILKKPIKNRKLIYNIVDGGTGRENNNLYDINIAYKVRGNIFDLKNWEQIK